MNALPNSPPCETQESCGRARSHPSGAVPRTRSPRRAGPHSGGGADCFLSTTGMETGSARACTAASTAMTRTARRIISSKESRETLLLQPALTTPQDGTKVRCPDNQGSYRHRSGPTFAPSASGKEWRMTGQREQAAAMEDAWAGQNLAQFEPDPEGYDASVTQAAPVASADADAPWI